MARRTLLLLLLVLLALSLSTPAAARGADDERAPPSCGRPAAQAHLVLCDWDGDGRADSWYATHASHGLNATSEGNRSAEETYAFHRVAYPGQVELYANAYRWTNGSHNHTYLATGVLTHRTGPLGTQAAQASMTCRGEGHAGQCQDAWWDARAVSARAGRTQSVTLVRDDSGTWACMFGTATLGCHRLLP